MRQKNQFLSIALFIYAFSCGAKDAKDLIHYEVHNSNAFATVHVLTIDPKKVKIIAVRAQDIGQGLSTVGNMAKQFNALAGINGGFFRRDALSVTGLPAGPLKINNAWHGIAYKPRGAIGWDPKTNHVLMDIVQTDSSVVIKKNSLPVNSMNKPLQGNKTMLLSDSFIDPIEINGGMNLVIAAGQIQAIYSEGIINVPKSGYIYRLPAPLASSYAALAVGDGAHINIAVQPQLDKSSARLWNKMPFIMGGGPLLIKGGKKYLDNNKEQMHAEFLYKRHARTAVGILRDKRWVLIVAESDILEDKPGMTIFELRDFMHNLGCVAALNLDGGSSSTIYIDNVKHASITDQLVADAILITSR